MGVRNWILAGLALSLFTIVFTAIRYPSVFYDGPIPAIVSLGFLLYTYVAFFHTRPKMPEDATVLRLGSRYGLAIGSLMMSGVLDLNFRVGTGWLLLILAVLFPVVAGAHASIKLWSVGAGLRVDFWSGLISGLIFFLGLMAYGYILAFIPGIPGAEFPKHSPYTAFEYQVANVGDVLGGGLAMGTFGLVEGVIAGIVGGVLGMLLTATGRSPEEPRRILW
jgi:hypothetical protein